MTCIQPLRETGGTQSSCFHSIYQLKNQVNHADVTLEIRPCKEGQLRELQEELET